MLAAHKNRRFKVNVLVAALLILTSVGTLVSFQHSAVSRSTERAYASLENQAAQQKEVVLTALNCCFDQLNLLAAGFSAMDGLTGARMTEYLSRVAEATDFSTVGWAGLDGMLRLSTGNAADISQRSYFLACLRGESPLEFVEEGIISGAPRLLLSVPVMQEGEVTGVVTGSFAQTHFNEFLSVKSPKGDNYMFICDRDGRLMGYGENYAGAVSSTVDGLFAEGNLTDFDDEYNAESFLAGVEAARPGIFHYRTNAGERYAAYMPLGVNGWVLFNAVPAETVLSEARETVRIGVASVTVIASISLVLLLYIVRLMNRWTTDLEVLQKYELNRLRSRAEADSLTGLLNNKAVRTRIADYLQEEGRRGRHALFSIDLDNFKNVNDTLGHPQGDQILIRIANQIKRTFRSSDILGRPGGDEFMVLMRDAGSDAIVRLKAAELRENLRLLRLGADGPPITCSIGAAVTSGRGLTFEELYKRADKAMYAAKAAGRDSFMLYSDLEQAPLEQMDEFFNARVAGYDEHMLTTVDGCREGYERMARLLGDNTEKILDLGCGTGLELGPIFARFPALAVTGYDLSEAMLGELKRKFPDQNILLRCADYFEAELGSAVYDAVVSFQSLHHFEAERKLALYGKVYRSLKPGGRFIDCDYMVLEQTEESNLMNRRAALMERQGLSECEGHFHFDIPLTVEHELELMRKAGFAKASLVWRQYNTTLVVAEK